MPLPLGPFPYILTDGTLADANQVMANFNLLLNGVNGLAPLGVSTPGQTSNVRANLATAGTSVTVTADIVNVATALNGTSYTLVSYSQAFNGATTGAGGMDTGTLPTSGWLALYAIYNPTAPSISILGTNAGVSSPAIYGGANMPAGYVASALLAVWRTNATPALVPSYVRNKKVYYQSAIQALNTNSNSVAAGTALSIVSSEPPNAIAVWGTMSITTGGSPSNATIQFGVQVDSIGNFVQQIEGNANSIAGLNFAGSFGEIATPTPQTIYYGLSNGGTAPNAQLYISGYTIP